MKTPKFLQELMRSPAYMDKNSDVYAMAEKYLKILYPGELSQDATGRMIAPEYDMTLTQFNTVQAELDAVLEETVADTEAEYEEAGQEIDVEDYVELEETINVTVLMPDGHIENKQLEFYTLNLPEDAAAPNDKIHRVWCWHAEDGDNTCSECASRDGEIYYSEDDIPEIPVHPNCRCTITEDVIDSDGNTISSTLFSPKKPTATPEKATFERPVDTKSGYYAVFDGKKFTLYVDNKPAISWDAVSGQPGYQKPEYQNRESKGPIPEGTYVARQEELQHIAPVGLVAGLIPGKYGEWPGSIISWGNFRVWLEPSKETNTYDRDSFSIHGGWFSGSAGCIDLTSHMNNFVALFGFIGKDLIVNVQY